MTNSVGITSEDYPTDSTRHLAFRICLNLVEDQPYTSLQDNGPINCSRRANFGGSDEALTVTEFAIDNPNTSATEQQHQTLPWGFDVVHVIAGQEAEPTVATKYTVVREGLHSIYKGFPASTNNKTDDELEALRTHIHESIREEASIGLSTPQIQDEIDLVRCLVKWHSQLG